MIGRNQLLNGFGEYLIEKGCPELIQDTIIYINGNLLRNPLKNDEVNRVIKSLLNRRR